MSIIFAPVLVLSVGCTKGPDPDKDNGSHAATSPQVILPADEHWAARRAILEEVDYWLYLLDTDLDQAIVEQIANSGYEMVVIDFISSEEGNEDYPMADVVQRIQASDPAKLVMAYIDIGQAESYRSYWRDDWRIGHPEWIAGADPDGWEENYPVAFWYDEWRQIWLGPGGLIQEIVAAGFNGIYLDWVEAYSDENVFDIAEDEGIDTRQEMVGWVSDLAQAGRERLPEFLVIGQNAAELLDDPWYLDTIDAIAQEQIWFDGGADDEPQGDCPSPRTEEEVDSKAYRNSLSTVCRRIYDNYPESTLHVSSEWYLENLEPARASGLPVFTVDYALDLGNIDWIYKTSRANGFIPFVSNRALDTFIDRVK